MTFTPGSRLGSYEIRSPIGEGGMGVVYRARDRSWTAGWRTPMASPRW
jgi:hypothetical protein